MKESEESWKTWASSIIGGDRSGNLERSVNLLSYTKCVISLSLKCALGTVAPSNLSHVFVSILQFPYRCCVCAAPRLYILVHFNILLLDEGGFCQMQVAIMDHKLTTLLSTIAFRFEEDVQKLFIEVLKFHAIHVCMITKMQEQLADSFEDSRTILESLKPPRRSCRLSTLPSTSTHIETRDNDNLDGSFSEPLGKTDKEVDYVLESEAEASGEECREPIAPQTKLVCTMLFMVVHCNSELVFFKFFFTMH